MRPWASSSSRSSASGSPRRAAGPGRVAQAAGLFHLYPYWHLLCLRWFSSRATFRRMLYNLSAERLITEKKTPMLFMYGVEKRNKFRREDRRAVRATPGCRWCPWRTPATGCTTRAAGRALLPRGRPLCSASEGSTRPVPGLGLRPVQCVLLVCAVYNLYPTPQTRGTYSHLASPSSDGPIGCPAQHPQHGLEKSRTHGLPGADAETRRHEALPKREHPPHACRVHCSVSVYRTSPSCACSSTSRRRTAS